jgi:hypothetical protein
MAKRKKVKGVVKANFGHKDAKGSGGKVNPRVPSGGYVLKVVNAEPFESQGGNPGVKWDFVISEGPKKGKKYRERTMLMPRNLWYLRQLLEAMGKKVPSKVVSLTLSKYIGQKVGAVLIDDEFEGKPQSKVDEFITVEEAREYEAEEDEDEDDEDEDEDDDDDEDDDEEEEDDDEDEDDEDEDEDEDEDDEDIDLDDEL